MMDEKRVLSHLLQQIEARTLLAALGLGFLIFLTTLGLALAHNAAAVGLEGKDAFFFELFVFLFSQVCVRKEWAKNNYFKSI
ncbi:hypothetical protein [Aureitalea marina]|uniref:hypothetical protein n=1 Tax=Aureitalea marina TaxID=930804 RepID=UPI0015E423E8|nr:hypothetical protein [Aureitalea marina]